jgi:lactate dehydrogenase-like 2-hydroxyacid dehydrogenase
MSVRPHVLVTRRLPDPVEQRLARDYDVTLNPADVPLGRADLIAAVQAYDAVVPTITDRLDADIIASGNRLRVLANYGAGLDHIDLAAARAAGVAVSNTPGALTEATAELAILLMLMAARRAGEGEREVRGGDWTGWRPTHLVGRGLSGCTLGLIGFGRIAQSTAAKARGLGLRIVYASRTPAPPDTERLLEATRMPSVEALMAAADIVSLHVPGGKETHHLVDAALLAHARPGAILINTARGSVIDEAALVAALANGRIGSVGLDVYENEPTISPALLQSERAVLLPHLGSATREARVAMGMQAADNLDAFFSGEPLPDRVA